MGIRRLSDDASMLGSATWTECAEAGSTLLVVPLGSCEQHGPHLPLDTDTRIADAVARRWAASRDGVTVAPVLAYGASGEHAGFPGTLSLGTEALTRVLVELGRSADHFDGIVWISGHGGNAAALNAAVDLLGSEGRRTLAHLCGVAGGDAHAGHTETSVMSAVAPETVRQERAEPGCTRPWSEIREQVLRDGVGSVSPNGVLGDPRGSGAGEGQRFLDAMVDRLDAAVTAWADEQH